MEKIKNILIVAGEASGDLFASELIKAMKEIYPCARFFGLGGKNMKREGVNLYFDIVELAVVGFFEVLKNLNKFKTIFKGIIAQVDRAKPDLAILVDYPGFNLRLAGELKKRDVPIVYYISPQVWAWGEKRIETIKRCVDRMVVFFKFEEELYKKHAIAVSFVGHPLLDLVKPQIAKKELFNRLGLNLSKPALSLLPGSREKEVKTLLPIMLDAANLIYKKTPNSQFLILKAPTVKEEIFSRILSRYYLPIYTVSNITYDALAASDFALVASGTATLETMILGIPMVILYKVSFLSWLYLKMLIKIPYIGMVNIIAGSKIIPEFIQYQANPKKIASYIENALTNPEKLDKIKKLLSCVKENLGETGASYKAAEIIVEFLKGKGYENKPHTHN